MLIKLQIYELFEDLLKLIGVESPSGVIRRSYKDHPVYLKYKEKLRKEIEYVKSKDIFIEKRGVEFLKDIRGLNIPEDHEGILKMNLEVENDNPHEYYLVILDNEGNICQHIEVKLNYTNFDIKFDFSYYVRNSRSKELNKYISRDICNNFLIIKDSLFKIDALKNILWLMEDSFNNLSFIEGKVVQSRSLKYVPDLLLTLRKYFLRMFNNVEEWEYLLDDIKSPVMDDLMMLYLGHYNFDMIYTKYTLDTHPITKNKTLTVIVHDEELFFTARPVERSITFPIKNIFEIGDITISDLYDNVCVRETNFKIKPFKELIVALFWRYFLRYPNIIK